jgi:ribosomal protein S18 acetylase RimI-like enzyme
MSGLGFARQSGRRSPASRLDRSAARRAARLAPWRGDPAVAHLVVAPDAVLTAADVAGYVERARAQGYRGIVTGAMSEREAAPFVAHDFAIYERLHLLAAELHEEPPSPEVTITHVRRREHDTVLQLDAAAFTGFWRLGPIGLRDALEATPARQFRAARSASDGRITGYAITGLAAPHGFLQRIATDPTAVRSGIGRGLVLDAFRYLWPRGATRVLVNTQLDNKPALALYDACGFELLPHGLTVMERAL